MKHFKNFMSMLLVLSLFAGLFTGCGSKTEEPTTSMKVAYADLFEIGVCINPTVITGDYAKLIVREFSSVTCENHLKPESVLDKQATLADVEGNREHLMLNFSDADKEAAFAKENGMKMRGHTIVWHQQTPEWIFYDNFDKSTGGLASRELMLARLENYMKDLFAWADKEYPNLFYAWDVVNEAMDDSGKLRESYWYQTIGEDYVEQAFAIARKYAPDYIKLFYNDYNEYQVTKRDAIIDMLRPVAANGNIDGVGMQGHLSFSVRGDKVARAAEKYASELGVVIHVTEIDVSMPGMDDPEHFQAMYYGELFHALRDAREKGVPIESVSIWGLTDDLSWKAEEKPLVFNADLSPKEAYEKILAAAE